VPEDFDTMFAEEIEALFTGPAASRRGKAGKRR
jgi:hypothetical protein